MSPNRFFISDTHFRHKNIVKFPKNKEDRGKEGVPMLRPWATMEEHDEALIENWNKVVKPTDIVYHLGDFCMSKKGLELVSQLNGLITLVPGNHCQFGARTLVNYFHNVVGILTLNDYSEDRSRRWVCTHIPVAASQLHKRWGVNIHGHLHDHVENDPRYLNVGCEQVNFSPLPWEEIEVRVKHNHEEFERTGDVVNYSKGYMH